MYLTCMYVMSVGNKRRWYIDNQHSRQELHMDSKLEGGHPSLTVNVRTKQTASKHTCNPFLDEQRALHKIYSKQTKMESGMHPWYYLACEALAHVVNSLAASMFAANVFLADPVRPPSDPPPL